MLNPGKIIPDPFLFSFNYVASGLVLVGSLQLQLKNLAFRLLAFVGYYSYSIYLWHLLLLGVMKKIWIIRTTSTDLPPGNLLNLSIYFFGSILFGMVMSNLIEIPALRVRDRFFPSRSKAI